MGGLIVKAAILLAWTRVLRAVGRRAGPRSAGLLLGLPSTTAVALVACGLERGPEASAIMAEAGMLGLAAAVALPTAFADAVGRGRRLGSALAAGLAAYAAVAIGLSRLPAVGGVAGLAIAAGAILAADRRVGRREAGAVEESGSTGPSKGSPARSLVPVACLAVVTGLRDSAGASWAGLLTPFPGTTLALLVATHAEAGPSAVRRLAGAVPRGSLGTLAFLAAFRCSGHGLGPAGAATVGYAAALATMLIAEVVAAVVRDEARDGGGA